MKTIAGLLILAASLQPYIVWADYDAAAAAAAAAAASEGDGAAAAAAAAAAASSPDDGAATAAAAAAAASAGDGAATSAAAAAAAASAGDGAATAIATATATITSSAHIPCRCNRIYKPVCGCDGRTYSNECVLKCISAHRVENNFPPIHVKSLGECTYRPCRCSAGGKPLCGTDGQTYGNDCYFICENARREFLGLAPIKVAYRGVCTLPICICPDVIIPVCGTDGRTYKNVCVLQCVSRHAQAKCKSSIRVKYEGVCNKENCICPLNIDPLCANDQNTYNNQCHLQCENRKRNQLGKRPLVVQYKGKCVDCRCPKIYAPVCACNGVTFANACTLGCENKRREKKNLPLLTYYYGVCPCQCELVYYPVCGTDDRTYANKCQLGCENKRRYDLGLPLIAAAYRGRCRSNCWYCSRLYKPVCGSDGRTYWNECWLKCNSGCRNNIGRRVFVRYNGPC